MGTLDVEHAIDSTGVLALQQCDGHIVDWNAAWCFSLAGSVVRMSMNDQVGSVAVDDFGKTGGPEKRKYIRRFPLDSRGHWRIMQHHDALGCSQLRHRTLQPQSLVNTGPNESFDFGLPESR